MKFDFAQDEKPLEIGAELESLIAGRRVLILGSTREGEEEIILPELKRLIEEKDAFVIIAPRKPERFDAVGRLLGANAISFVRRSELHTENGEPRTANAFLLDSVGELTRIYRYATVAFIQQHLLN